MYHIRERGLQREVTDLMHTNERLRIQYDQALYQLKSENLSLLKALDDHTLSKR